MNVALVKRPYFSLKVKPTYPEAGNNHCYWCPYATANWTGGNDCNMQCSIQARTEKLNEPDAYYFVETMTLITARLTK